MRRRCADPRWRLLSEAARRGGVTHRALVQIAFVLGLGFLVYEAASLALARMHAHHIPTDFGFWNERAGFDIDPHLIAYSFTSTYGRAFFVGLINTLVVSAVGIVFASLLGFAIGAARLSSNLVVAKFAGIYVEALRNVPLLLQILFWYNGVLKALPAPRASLTFPGIFFSTIAACSCRRRPYRRRACRCRCFTASTSAAA